MTVRQQILDEITNRLQTIRPAYQWRLAAIEESELPVFNVFDVSNKVTSLSNVETLNELQIQVDIAHTDEQKDNIRTLLQQVLDVIRQDETLGGLCEEIRYTSDYFNVEKDYAVLSINFIVKYVSRRWYV